MDGPVITPDDGTLSWPVPAPVPAPSVDGIVSLRGIISKDHPSGRGCGIVAKSGKPPSHAAVGCTSTCEVSPPMGRKDDDVCGRKESVEVVGRPDNEKVESSVYRGGSFSDSGNAMVDRSMDVVAGGKYCCCC